MTTEYVLPEISAARGLPLAESEMLRDLVAVWRNKLSRNVTRRRYYDCHNWLKDLGISIPPTLRNVETAVGWPALARGAGLTATRPATGTPCRWSAR